MVSATIQRPADAFTVSPSRREAANSAHLSLWRKRAGGVPVSALKVLRQPLQKKRLTTMRDTEDGFGIAETDLEMRGAGDLIGTAQSGLPVFRVADLEGQAALMAAAQRDAHKLLADDPELASTRGQAARVLLWLMEQDQAIRLISIG